METDKRINITLTLEMEIAMLSFAERTGITISTKPSTFKPKESTKLSFDNSVSICEYFHRTGKVPPINLHSWVTCYNIITGTRIL